MLVERIPGAASAMAERKRTEEEAKRISPASAGPGRSKGHRRVRPREEAQRKATVSQGSGPWSGGADRGRSVGLSFARSRGSRRIAAAANLPSRNSHRKARRPIPHRRKRPDRQIPNHSGIRRRHQQLIRRIHPVRLEQAGKLVDSSRIDKERIPSTPLCNGMLTGTRPGPVSPARG
jgi:hypothetical protein